MGKTAHPETIALIHQILNDIGYDAKFIDLMTHGYRVKLGTASDPAKAIIKIQKKLNAAGWTDIEVKQVGSRYDPDRMLGFTVPFIEKPGAVVEGLHAETKELTKEILKKIKISGYLKLQKNGYLGFALPVDRLTVDELQKTLKRAKITDATAVAAKKWGEEWSAIFVPFID